MRSRDRSGVMWAAMAAGSVCCAAGMSALCLSAPGAEQAKSGAGLPKIVLLDAGGPPGYLPLVAKKLEGRAVVVGVPAGVAGSGAMFEGLADWVIREQPSVAHFEFGLEGCGNLKGDGPQDAVSRYETNLRKIVSRLQKETSAALVFAIGAPDAGEGLEGKINAIALAVMREAGIPVHDLRGLAGPKGGDERLAEAVADCVMRQWIVKKYSAASAPKPSGPEAAERYRKAEAERDAAVPTKYRNFKFGEFAMPSSPEAWREQRASVHRTVVNSLGELPPRPSPPRARVVSREIRCGYTLERVAIDNGDGNDISALLLVPEKRRGPAPAILWLHSSTPDKNQLITPNTNGGELPLGEAFVRAGYVVLAPDACLYGERAANGPSGALESYRRDVADSFVAAQDRLFKWNLWLGRTLWGMFVRDDQIALDYLCARPEVDGARIGATGMSMGSTRSWWLSAVDDRIAAAVGVACLTRYENLIRHGNLRGHGLYYFSYGILKHFDTEGVLALIAPRPFLALTGDLDYGSPADGIRALEEKVGRVYATLGASDRFKSILYPDVGHAYTPEMRQEMLAWFERWLKP